MNSSFDFRAEPGQHALGIGERALSYPSVAGHNRGCSVEKYNGTTKLHVQKVLPKIQDTFGSNKPTCVTDM